MIDSPRLWYVLWWSAWTVGAAALAHVVVVRPITRRLDVMIDETREATSDVLDGIAAVVEEMRRG